MPSLQQRLSARGFPSAVIAGQTGAGALESQGSPQDPAHGQTGAGSPGYTTQVLPQFGPEQPAELYIPVGLGFPGLPGTLLNPDRTVSTVDAERADGSYSRGDHAAPVPGWAPADGYVTSQESADAIAQVRQNSMAIHGVNFGALEGHTQVATDPMTARTFWYSNDPGENVAEPVTGQLRNMGGFDATQGYGGGSTGPGGINDYGLGAPHVDRFAFSEPQPQPYLDPAERPFLAPQGGVSFVPTDAVQGQPYTSYLNAPGVIYSAPTAYSPPPDPAVSSAPVTAAAPSAGWW